MRRQRLIVGIAFASCLLSLAAALFVSGDAEAQRGRRGRGRRGRSAATAPEEAPQSAEIAPSLGEVSWGMSPAQTFEHLQKQVTESYRERISKAARTDTIQEDRLRQQMTQEAQRIRQSFVRFRGQASGWDTHFIRDEFTHGNNESMMLWRDDATHSQRFYFFINDRLWKVFQAFDTSVFPGATFDQFSEAIQSRFGRGVQRNGALVEGRPPTRWIEWQDATTRLRAVDFTRFYGFFCLVFEDKGTLSQLASLRTHTIARGGDGHALVDSVLREDPAQPGGSESSEDAHSDIADRITGQVRRRTDAPEGGAAASAGASSSAGARTGTPTSSTSSSGTSSAGSRADPDDPFAGMDL